MAGIGQSSDDGAKLLPLVRSAPAGFPVWVFVVGMIAVAALLFSVLESRRQASTVASEPR